MILLSIATTILVFVLPTCFSEDNFKFGHKSPKEKPLMVRDFYRLDALPVTQMTVFRNSQIEEWSLLKVGIFLPQTDAVKFKSCLFSLLLGFHCDGLYLNVLKCSIIILK